MSCTDEKTISVEELADHSTKESLWIAIDGKVLKSDFNFVLTPPVIAYFRPCNAQVYDITEWLERHPGGVIPLLDLGGRDATDAFNAFHPPSVSQTH